MMTLFIADMSKWQGSLTVSQLKAAGFNAINFKVSHGLTEQSVHPKTAQMISETRAAGMGVASFAWLDNSASGVAQARYAFERMQALGITNGHFAHFVDCESNATETQYRDFVAEMEVNLMRRFISTYTGDYWWEPRGWRRQTVWLHAAPNAGYQPAYPGDSSPHWAGGYGGWDSLSVMQYAVKPVAGINVSMSAVRDITMWKAMTGEDMSWFVVAALNQLLSEFNQVFPNRDKASDGGVGDTDHAARPSGHNPDETGSPEDTDPDNLDEVRARDFDKDLNMPGVTMEDVAQYLVRECRAGRITWIKYIIFNRRIWKASNGWATQAYTGTNPHDKHMHVSSKADTASENNTRPVGLAELVEELTMPSVNEIVAALRPVIRQEVKAELDSQRGKIAEEVAEYPVDIQTDTPGVNMQPWSRVDAYGRDERAAIQRTVEAVAVSVGKVLERLPEPQPPAPTR